MHKQLLTDLMTVSLMAMRRMWSTIRVVVHGSYRDITPAAGRLRDHPRRGGALMKVRRNAWGRAGAATAVMCVLIVMLVWPAGAQTPAPTRSLDAAGPVATFYPQPGGLSAAPGPVDRRGVSFVAYGPDGATLAVGTPFGIDLFSLAGMQNVQYLDSIQTGVAVTALAFAPDGNLLASGTFTDTVQLWDVRIGALKDSLQAVQGAVNALAFSPDGALIAAAGSDGAVRIWRTSDAELTLTLKGHAGAVLGVAFSPDGQRLLSSGADGKVQLWSLSNGLSMASLVGNVGGAPAATFDPTGNLVGLGAGDGVVRIWDFKAGKLAYTLAGHRGAISDVAFAPDGATLASASYDGNVLLWRVADGTLVRSLQGTAALGSLAFAPDGAGLATGALDGAVQLWALGGVTEPARTPIVILPPAPLTTPTPPAPPCTDDSAYVADLTLPDNSIVAPGSLLNKTWRVRNSGTCAWTPGYRFAFSGGSAMNAAPAISLPEVAPGATVDITVPMYAPATPGSYQGIWQFVNAAGQPFGVRVTVRVIVPAPVTPTPVFSLNITASATDINAGDNVTVRASVQSVAAAWVDGQPVTNNYLEETVRLCDDRTFTLDAQLTNGQHQTQSVTVHVNGSCVRKPDLVMRSLSADHTTVHVSQTVHLSARVKNQGDKDAKHFAVAWDPGNGAGWIIVANDVTIDQGDDQTFDWTYAFPATGNFHTRVKADYYNDIDESDKDNNEKGLSIKVEP
jgi:WD40 repeat protein